MPYLWIFAAALLVRLVIGLELAALPINRTPKLDSFEYLAWARRLAAGDFTWPIASPHSPGYPLFLAAVLAVASSSLRIVVIVQSVVGAITAVAVAVAGARLFDRRVALAAGLTYAVYGPAVYIDTALLSEGLLLCLLAVALAALAGDAGWRRILAAGIALGGASVVRPTAAVILLPLAIAVATERQRHRPVQRAVVLLAAALIVAAPFALKTWQTSGQVVTQGFGGLNFYIGNSPMHTGTPSFRPGGAFDALNSEAARSGISDPSLQDRYYVHKALAEIRERPLGYAGLVLRKALWLVQAEEVRDSHSYYFFTTQSALLRLLPRMSVLFPLALAGFAVVLLQRRIPVLLLAYLAGGALTTILFVAGLRYRMPVVPALAMLAGAGIVGAFDSAKARNTTRLGAIIAAVIIGVFTSHLLSDARSHNFAEEWAMTGSALVTERRLPEAELAYRQAVALDDRSGLAWDGLGLALYDAGRLSDARMSLEHALQLEPSNGRAAFHVGLVDQREGKLEAAVANYRTAAALLPGDIDLLRTFAAVLVQLHRDAEALPLLTVVANQSPNDAEAQRALGGALGGLGRMRDAAAALRRAVTLAPQNGEAWMDLCLVSLDLGDVATAEWALGNARQAGAAPERIALGSRALDQLRARR
jgi:Flp pilus assembly protein TadD/4-amino-4-deoxy-L-arabinose transferase-like glycosyltransferase